MRLFLADEIDMIQLPSVCHIKAIFAEIKRRYTDILNQVLKKVGQSFTLTWNSKNAKAPKDIGTIDGTGFNISLSPSETAGNVGDGPNRLELLRLFQWLLQTPSVGCTFHVTAIAPFSRNSLLGRAEPPIDNSLW
jgi:hypothetical protein